MVRHVFSKRYSKISCRQYHWGLCGLCGQSLLEFLPDIEQLEISKSNPMIQTYYDAQVSLSWMVAMVSGVVLSLTSVLLMCFLYQTICRRPQGTIRNFKGFGL